MTYEIYRYVFLGGAIASGIMLAVTVILFFTLRIPKVISDLTGRTAKRAIEDIRRQNEEGGDQNGLPGNGVVVRSKMTDKISKSGRVVPRPENSFVTGVVTQKISTQQLPPQEPAEETMVLGSVSETTVLDAGGETMVLSPVQVPQVQIPQVFAVEFEITYIHTNELIA